MKAFSVDLRERILNAYDAGEGTRQQIADRFAVSLAMVKKLMAQRKATGSIEEIPKPGRTPIFRGELLEELDAYMRAQPDATLEEIRGHFSDRVRCSNTAVTNGLRYLEYRRKKTLNASEQNRPDVALQRDRWRTEQPGMDTERLIFLDESGAKTNMTRLRARVKGGARAYDWTPSGHWSTTTMISSLRLDGQTAAMVLDGATDRASFVEYVRQVLAPTLRPGDVVVLDNLSSHKNPAVRRLIEQRGASLTYLPPYSPDLNPIEKMWSKVKELLRGAKARTEEALFEQIGKTLERVTPDDAAGWFTSCGYVLQ